MDHIHKIAQKLLCAPFSLPVRRILLSIAKPVNTTLWICQTGH